MASNSSSAAASRFRQKCFLCDVPRGPWAMLTDFTEPVCRACCNYEGIDRVEEVIDRARQQKKQAEALLGRVNETASRFGQRDVVEVVHTPVALPVQGSVSEPSQLGLNQYVVSTPAKLGNSNTPTTIPRSMAATATRMIPVIPPPPQPNPLGGSFHQRAIHTDAQNVENHAQRMQLINDSLTTLSKCSPFRVRFSKDHSLIGRAFAFDAVCRGSEYELKVYIEYPVGSGRVFQSASGAGRQMYGEFRERLGIGGGFKGASSNGYKDLEFERSYGSEDWRVLGELLSEDVRFFRGPIRGDLLPVPFIDPKYPHLPAAQLNASSKGFLRNSGALIHPRKRGSGSDDEPDNRKRTPSPPSSENGISPKSPKSDDSPTTQTSRHSPAQQMQCMLCQKTLEDTRFVQCPSVPSHKFCFSCSRDSIKKQSAASSDIYCPSGQKCLVMGSSTPWAFMEAEIATIVECGNL